MNIFITMPKDAASTEGHSPFPLTASNKSHCELLLRYAKETWPERTQEMIAQDFETLWRLDGEFPLHAVHTARANLEIALNFIDRCTLSSFIASVDDQNEK